MTHEELVAKVRLAILGQVGYPEWSPTSLAKLIVPIVVEACAEELNVKFAGTFFAEVATTCIRKLGQP